MKRRLRGALAGVGILLFAACSGGGGSGGDSGNAGGGTQPPSVKMTEAEASRFLARATFGTTEEEVKHLQAVGYEAWLNEQFAEKPGYHMVWAEANARGVDETKDLTDDPEGWKRYADTLGYLQRDVWWHLVTRGKDQLRQRVAFALSEILVISRNNSQLSTEPDARMSYYDLLVRYAFGNYEELLKAVTYHPAMGKYLSYLGNSVGDPAKGIHPDENYAREVMQLFTIGLYQLNSDGSRRLDGGKPIPTYTQKDVREMARVFTGLTDNNGFFFPYEGGSSHASRTEPMIAVEEYHDSGAKEILGHSFAAGMGTKAEIDAALHMLFMHPNTGPFISRQLIQRLVTDNPSPAYIRRVAEVFDDNGQGVRGDLKAVVRAILLDPEAMEGVEGKADFGKFREPLLYVSQLFRTFHASEADNTLRIYDGGPAYRYPSYHFHGTGMTRQEGPLEALTVFNYFTPDDGPAELKEQGLVAPELQLYGKQGIDDVVMGLVTQNGFIYDTYGVTAELDLSRESALAKAEDYAALVDRLDLLLTGKRMSDSSRRAVADYLQSVHHQTIDGYTVDDDRLVRYAVGLVMASPDYALQR